VIADSGSVIVDFIWLDRQLKIRLTTLFWLIALVSLAMGWSLERQRHSASLRQIQKRNMIVNELELEVVAASETNQFALHTFLLERGFEKRTGFENWRQLRLIENVINLYEMEVLLESNELVFENAGETRSDLKGDINYYAGESLSFLEIENSEQFVSELQAAEKQLNFQNVSLEDDIDMLNDSFSDFLVRSLREFGK